MRWARRIIVVRGVGEREEQYSKHLFERLSILAQKSCQLLADIDADIQAFRFMVGPDHCPMIS